MINQLHTWDACGFLSLIVRIRFWLVAAGHQEIDLQGSEMWNLFSCQRGTNWKLVVCHWCKATLIEGEMISIWRQSVILKHKVPLCAGGLNAGKNASWTLFMMYFLSLSKEVDEFYSKDTTKHIQKHWVVQLFFWNHFSINVNWLVLEQKNIQPKLKYMYQVESLSRAMIREMAWGY